MSVHWGITEIGNLEGFYDKLKIVSSYFFSFYVSPDTFSGGQVYTITDVAKDCLQKLEKFL